jgi:pyruvate carboxylase
VVGDMALYMVTSGLAPEQVVDPAHDTGFPESVVQLFRGELGQPPGGWPKALQAKVLAGEQPLLERPGASLPATDLAAAREELQKKIGRKADDCELASYLMYPKVFIEYAAHLRHYGEVAIVPTPIFLYGFKGEEEIAVDIEPGKTLIVRLLAVGDPDGEGKRKLFFELNGQPRTVMIADSGVTATTVANRRAEEGNPAHVAAPMPGLVVSVSVKEGHKVARGDALVSIEAMKMETVLRAERDAVVRVVVAPVGTQVAAHDLLVEFEPEHP